MDLVKERQEFERERAARRAAAAAASARREYVQWWEDHGLDQVVARWATAAPGSVVVDPDRAPLRPARPVRAPLEDWSLDPETGTVLVVDLMGSEDTEPGLERGDGFYVSHLVAATEPWRPSDRRSGPLRVRAARTRNRPCGHCGRAIRSAGPQQRYHQPGTRCYRDRVREATRRRVAAHRARAK